MWGGHKTRWWFNNHDEGGKRRNYLLKNVLRILFWCSSFLRILTNRAGGSQAVAKFTKVVVFVFHSRLLRTVEFAAFLFSCRSKRLLQPRIMVRFRRETGIKKKKFLLENPVVTIWYQPTSSPILWVFYYKSNLMGLCQLYSLDKVRCHLVLVLASTQINCWYCRTLQQQKKVTAKGVTKIDLLGTA